MVFWLCFVLHIVVVIVPSGKAFQGVENPDDVILRPSIHSLDIYICPMLSRLLFPPVRVAAVAIGETLCTSLVSKLSMEVLPNLVKQTCCCDWTCNRGEVSRSCLDL